jgi:RNA polymerase sigma-70 factor (ECF subfamily)
MMRHEQDAEDVVQEAFLRAYRYFQNFEGDTGRPWILQIVRNTCCTWLAKKNPGTGAPATSRLVADVPSPNPGPDAELMHQEDRQAVLAAVADLAPEYREVLVLREFEGLSYKEIARIIEVPVGTVMSRLARARERLHGQLDAAGKGESSDGMS